MSGMPYHFTTTWVNWPRRIDKTIPTRKSSNRNTQPNNRRRRGRKTTRRSQPSRRPQAQRPRRTRRRTQRGGPRYAHPFHSLGGEAQRFAVSLGAAHDENAKGAYRPDDSCKPSLKHACRSRVILTIPTSSKVILFVNPGMGSDQPAIFAISGTTASFNGVNATYNWTTQPAGLSYTTYSMPMLFSSSALATNGIDFRAGAFGIKCRYTGAALNRGGSALWYCDPDGGRTLMSQTQASTTKFSTWENNYLALQPQARYTNFNTNDTHEFVAYSALYASEWLETNMDAPANGLRVYSDRSWALKFGNNAATTEAYYNPNSVLILSNNTSANSLEFTIELVYHYEYHGGSVQGLHTPSPSDIQGCTHVLAAHEHANQSHSQDPDTHPLTHLCNSMSVVVSKQATKVAEGVLTKYATPNNIERLATGLGSMFL